MKTAKNRITPSPLSFCAAILLAAIFFTSCNTPDKKSGNEEPDNSNYQPIIDTNAVKADWEKFKQDANEKIDQSRDSINAFKMKVKKADKKQKAGYERRAAELERRNEELKNKLEAFKMESKEKWDEFKKDFNTEMEKLKQELKDSTSDGSKFVY